MLKNYYSKLTTKNQMWILMRQTNKNIKDFYEHLYGNDQIINPAYEIYDKLRIKIIKSYLDKTNKNILVIGCGNRNDINLLETFSNPVLFDLSFKAVKSINKDLNVINADALSIPIADNSFDEIVCSEVLEHIPDIDMAISEMARVLKPDGNLIVSTPNWISLFGLGRWLMELFTKQMISSDNQPYDDWKTIWKLKRELSPYFHIDIAKGVWYLPPLHFRGRGLSKTMTKLIYLIFSPFEFILSNIFPYFGHLIILKCTKSVSPSP